MEFGKFLAKLRKERGILQKDLAGHLNVTVSTISNYEKGVHYPDLQTLVLIADLSAATDRLLHAVKSFEPSVWHKVYGWGLTALRRRHGR